MHVCSSRCYTAKRCAYSARNDTRTAGSSKPGQKKETGSGLKRKSHEVIDAVIPAAPDINAMIRYITGVHEAMQNVRCEKKLVTQAKPERSYTFPTYSNFPGSVSLNKVVGKRLWVWFAAFQECRGNVVSTLLLARVHVEQPNAGRARVPSRIDGRESNVNLDKVTTKGGV